MNEFQASWLVSAIGIANLAGRLIIGAISDFKSVNRVFIIASCMFGSGLSMAFMPLCHSAVPLFVCSGVFGFTFGKIVTFSFFKVFFYKYFFKILRILYDHISMTFRGVEILVIYDQLVLIQ